MIQLQPHPDGVVLPVRAQPGARRSMLRGEQDGALKVYVSQIAEKGKANRAIVELLCKALGLRRSQLDLIYGSTSAQKRFLVRDAKIDELRDRITTAIGEA